jgi:N-acetylglucosamine kinase-like BadF-type ATPase
MDLLLGIDGGGSKTEAVLCDTNGVFLRYASTEATNPTSVSVETIRCRLNSLFKDLLSGYQGLDTEILGCYAGIGGGGFPDTRSLLEDILRGLLPNTRRLSSGSDAVNSLNGGIGSADGILLIAGTGSSVFIRLNGTLRIISGWGYLLGDEGSGYDMGRMALVQALRARDGRGEPTLLTGLCEEKLGGAVMDYIPEIYRKGRSFIASFAPLVSRARDMGDPAASCCMEKAVQALAEAVRVAGGQFPAEKKPVVFTGGVFQDNFVEERLRNILGEAFHLIKPNLPPVYGALLEAAKLAGIAGGSEFEKVYQHTLDKGVKK